MARVLVAGIVAAFGVAVLVAPTAQATGTKEVAFTMSQVVSGDGLSTPPSQAFTYKLSSTNGGPLQAGSNAQGYTFSVTDTSDAQIGPIEFSAVGVYTYELRCVTAAPPGYTVDQRVYTITVYVTNGASPISVVYDGGGGKVSEISFAHTYATAPSDPAAMVDPPVEKTVRGNPPTSGTFTFELRADDPSSPMPAGAVGAVKSVHIVGAGKAYFGTWSYAHEGTYRYRVSEVNTQLDGYAYDTTVYTMTDTVAADGGQLVVARVITSGSGEQVTALPFVNTYRSTVPTDDPTQKAPQTGDVSNPVLWIALLAGAGVLLIVVMWRLWRSRESGDESHG